MALLVDGRGADQATLSVGDAFVVSDGPHASRFYRRIDIKQDRAVLRVSERFNALPFGDGIREAA